MSFLMPEHKLKIWCCFTFGYLAGENPFSFRPPVAEEQWIEQRDYKCFKYRLHFKFLNHVIRFIGFLQLHDVRLPSHPLTFRNEDHQATNGKNTDEDKEISFGNRDHSQG